MFADVNALWYPLTSYSLPLTSSLGLHSFFTSATTTSVLSELLRSYFAGYAIDDGYCLDGCGCIEGDGLLVVVTVRSGWSYSVGGVLDG